MTWQLAIAVALAACAVTFAILCLWAPMRNDW